MHSKSLFLHTRPTRAGQRATLLLACCAGMCAFAPSSGSQVRGDDLTALSLEELLEVEISSARKKTEELHDAACAMYVLTGEEIQQLGVYHIPEALRLVPGMHVARIDANKWALTARGFNGRFANKLLVLIDGRSVYTPLFGGVYWDAQDLLFEDLKRIEVIRGPGGTLWGSNAVNGVINVVTKSAAETQGFYARSGGGTHRRAFAEARYGGMLSEETAYRIYGKYSLYAPFATKGSNTADDGWEQLGGGFRLDWDRTGGSQVTLIGNAQYLRAGSNLLIPTLTAPTYRQEEDLNTFANGQNILLRWKEELSETSDVTFQCYYDRTKRRDVFLTEERQTVDVDLQHRFRVPVIQEIMWGASARVTSDDTWPTEVASLTPRERTLSLFGFFLQNDLGLIEDLLRATSGVKYEHSTLAGSEFQPSLHVLFQPHSRHYLWAAVSRSVRLPTRGDDDNTLFLNTLATTPPTKIVIRGSRDFTAEEIDSYEAGWRGLLRKNLTVDVAAYYNRGEDLRVVEPSALSINPGPPLHAVQTIVVSNAGEANVYGIEVASTWKPIEELTLSGSYTFFKSHFFKKATWVAEVPELRSPQNQLALRSSLKLPWNLQLTAALFLVEGLAFSHEARGYARLDLHLTYLPWGDERCALELGAQNLTDHRHTEFGDEVFERSSRIERSVYAAVSVRF